MLLNLLVQDKTLKVTVTLVSDGKNTEFTVKINMVFTAFEGTTLDADDNIMLDDIAIYFKLQLGQPWLPYCLLEPLW